MSEKSTTADLASLVRLSVELGNRGDYDGVMALWADNPIWDVSPMGLGVYEGTTAVREFFEDWVASYDRFEIDMEECRELGSGVVLSVMVQKGRPSGSSGEVTLRYASVSVLEDALIVRITNYTDLDEARAAAERLAEERADG
jgi:ketosteroid isomerase-like protein